MLWASAPFASAALTRAAARLFQAGEGRDELPPGQLVQVDDLLCHLVRCGSVQPYVGIQMPRPAKTSPATGG
jgi:hypothetical protein